MVWNINKSFCLGMQTLKGEPAKGTTSAEFVKIMKLIKGKADAMKKDRPGLFTQHRDFSYSYDNPQIHQLASEGLEKLGITQHDRAPLAEYSPDIHKVIEHVHGNSFIKEPTEDASVVSAKQYVQLMEKVFYEMSQASIKRDVKSLMGTYQEIIKVEGGWPKKCFR